MQILHRLYVSDYNYDDIVMLLKQLEDYINADNEFDPLIQLEHEGFLESEMVGRERI